MTQAPRVLMTADAVGGVWTYALELARGLADQGVETLLAVARARRRTRRSGGRRRGPGPAAGAHRPAARVAGPGRALDAGARRRLLGARARVPPRHRPRQRLPRGGGRLRRPGAARRALLRQRPGGGPAAAATRRPSGTPTRPACARAWRRPTRVVAPTPRILAAFAGTTGPAAAGARRAATGSTCRPRPAARAGPWSWPPGACGTRRRTSRASPPSRHGCPGRSRSPARRPPARPARACTTSAGWRRRTCTPGMARGGDLRGPRPLRALRPRHPRGRARRAARWSWATSRACASCGGAPPASSRRTSRRRCWRRSRELIADPSARERLADAARAAEPPLYTRARMAEGYLGLYGDLLAARRVVRRGAAGMRVVIFCHSLVSDWNHGNAHFLRGVVARAAARAATRSGSSSRRRLEPENLVARPGRRRRSTAGARPIPTCPSPRPTTGPARTSTGARRRRPGARPRVERARPGRRPRRAPGARAGASAAVPRHPPPRGQRPGGHRAAST